MAKISTKQYALALYEATKGFEGGRLDQAIEKFVEILVKHNKVKQVDEIAKEFERYAKKQQGIVEAEIVTARELDSKLIDVIIKKIGEKVEAKVVEDKNIIGGVKVKIEDKILDASIKNNLIKMKESLI